ncbi:MAG: AAA family ATPase [Calothrix sp. MO_167.B12]|nr:AAA family ATPase [Calothrix sp. MO_167.B12]
MHIEKLHIQNFRGFKEIIINFPRSNIAVFIGINGSGKSSILDCIAIMLFQFVLRLRARRQFDFRFAENDINIKSNSTINSITISTKQVDRLYWKIVEEVVSRQTRSNYDEISRYIKNLRNNLKSDPDLNLPVMVYYQTHRMVLKNPYIFEEKSSKRAKEEVYPQLYAYENAFSTGINNFQDFFDWFKEQEDYENEIRLRDSNEYRNPRLQIIRRAIEKFLECFSNSQFSNLRVVRSTIHRDFYSGTIYKYPSLTITKNDQDLRLEQLSDGEKMLLMLVTDLARRLAIANPSLDDALSGEGIVLIDEIDLHLHPQWQRNVISSLTQTFPNCQFIVTTHSPQVLSGVEKENVFILENYQIVNNTPYTYGKDSNSILYELMNVKERPNEVQQQIDRCFQFIDNDNLDAAKSALRELSNLLGENDLAVVRARTHISFLED